jgi:hypothetical protein
LNAIKEQNFQPANKPLIDKLLAGELYHPLDPRYVLLGPDFSLFDRCGWITISGCGIHL